MARLLKISGPVQAILNAAYAEAKMRSHEYLTPEHVLYAALSFDEVQGIVAACGVDPAAIRGVIEGYLDLKVPCSEGEDPIQTINFRGVIQRAIFSSQSAQKTTIDVADILVSLYDDERNFCGYSLRKAGIDRDELLKNLSKTSNQSGIAEAVGPDGEALDSERASKKKTTLERFAQELTSLAKEGKLEPVIGREAEIDRTIQVLCRRMKNNPVHVGDSGVGKTAVTEGLAQRIAADEVPPLLRGYAVYSIDMGAIIAGTRYRGDFEERIKRIVEEIQKKEKAILFVDEIHTLIGTGSASGSAMDAANLLKPVLGTGKVRCIGSTTHEEYTRIFDKDRALSRRFQKIDINEPEEADAIKILHGLKSRYERHHNVQYTDEAIEAAVKLSAQYITERRLPDKAIDVIDEAGACARIQASKTETPGTAQQTAAVEESVEPRKRHWTAFLEKLAAYERRSKTESPAAMSASASAAASGDTVSAQAGEVTAVTVDLALVESVVSKMARIPEKSIGQNERDKLQNLESTLKAVVFGQNEAVDAVARAVKRSRAGFRSPDKPVANFLFVGPTGVGKTELARRLADTLGITMHRFDMSEYQEKHTISRLIGSPPGYIGYEEGGLLTEAVRKQPHCVVLLDEIEKAHQDIYNLLLQIMDYASLTDNNGRKADFRNAVVIMTSNAGARDIGKNLIGFGDRVQDESAVNDAIEKIFSPEFRSRLDAVVPFHHLSKEIMIAIIRKEVDAFKKQLAEKKVSLEVTDACIERLAEEGYSREFGARNAGRVVEEKLKSWFVDEVLFGSLSEGGAARADYADGDYWIGLDTEKAYCTTMEAS
ncbi:MAG: AAA family ATPase [Treponema sp.]|jgi:ATP-dependent Clp protease ATP-binding subunit ClpA|nr:AAA family ATPase [Treponema sp.]